jgi:hypothetical protein
MSASAVIDLEPELDSEKIPGGGSSPSRRSLGLEIIFSACEDYRHGSGKDRASAEAFLFPETREYRRHFDLVCSMTNVDPRWLREALDRAGPDWDRERQSGMKCC